MMNTMNNNEDFYVVHPLFDKPEKNLIPIVLEK